MTTQEAIETIKYASAFNREDSPLTVALDMAIEALEKQVGIERALERLEEKLSQKHKLMLREDRDEIRYFYEMQMLKEAIEILKEEVGYDDSRRTDVD